MMSRLSMNYSDILMMGRNLHLFADPVNYCLQEEAIEETTPIRRAISESTKARVAVRVDRSLP